MAAEDTLSCPETNFFVGLDSRETLRSRAFGETAFYTWRYRKWLRRTGLPVRNTICRDRHECGRKFAMSMDTLAGNSGKKGWLEKSPKHIWHIETIQQAIPDAKFIHIVRSARQNIGSLLEWAAMNDRKMTPSQALEIWLRHLGRTLSFYGQPAHLFVRYEDLANEFDTEMKKVGRFIGITVPALQELDLRKFSQQVVRGHEVWKQKNLVEPKPKDSGLVKYEELVKGPARHALEEIIDRIECLLKS
jgi:hypothetical protein